MTITHDQPLKENICNLALMDFFIPLFLCKHYLTTERQSDANTLTFYAADAPAVVLRVELKALDNSF
jgi:hypothetical protein